MILISALTILIFLTTYFGTRAFIGWSRRRNILDIPNERSSHNEPVPVGAGLFIASGVIAGFAFWSVIAKWSFGESIPVIVLASILTGSTVIAAVSWHDDVKGIGAGPRLLVHSVCAGLVILASEATTPRLDVPGYILIPAGFLWIVGLTNAYNFMDGIDGIAGLQGALAGIGLAVIGHQLSQPALSALGMFLCSSCAAFLLFNWEPAKVFMGDVGSAFLGFTLSSATILALSGTAAQNAGERLPAGFWPVVMGSLAFVWPFVFDSSFTLARRLFNGEKVWLPHRSHLYQRMVLSGKRHGTVAVYYGALALFAGTVSAASGGNVPIVLLSLAAVAAMLLWFGFDPAEKESKK